MKVRLEVESDQIAMPGDGLLLVALTEANYIEAETGMGWVRLAASTLRDIWQKMKPKEERSKLVQIQ